MPRPGIRPGAAVAAALTLTLVLIPATAVTAHADDNPTAQPTPTAPTEIDPADPDLELPEGATLATPKVLDIVSITDSSTSEQATADDGEERQEESNSTVTYALQADVLFPKDSAKLNPGAGSRIKAIAAEIKAQKAPADPGLRLHRQPRLVRARPGAVQEARGRRSQDLAAALDADVTFEVRGYSEDYPIADNASEAGRKKNRRVEVTFTPPSS